MRITFLGATHEVTGSCCYVEGAGKRFLVDYGMEQGPNTFENEDIPIPVSELDFVLLTHAHIDHSGNLPLLYAKGFRGKVYTTEASADLCSIMLRDCAHIQMQEAEWKNRKAKRHSGMEAVEPAYKMEDADGIIRRIVPCPYEFVITTIYLCGRFCQSTTNGSSNSLNEFISFALQVMMLIVAIAIYLLIMASA